MNKIIRNTTGSNIFIKDTGINILANSSYDITEPELLLWVASTDVLPYIDIGDLVINNGTIDLPAYEGVRFLQYPDRVTIQKDALDVTRVTTEINFTGNVTVTNSNSGTANVHINETAALTPSLREVTAVLYPFGYINTKSGLLFEADPVNDTILFLKEEIL